MRLRLISEDLTLSHLYAIIEPYVNQSKAQWLDEMGRLVSDRQKKIQHTELNIDTPQETLQEIEEQFKSQGFLVRFKNEKFLFSMDIAMNNSDLEFWIKHGLSATDWSNGHPFLAGWMFGHTSNEISNYYMNRLKIPGEKVKAAFDADRELYET